MDNALTKYRGFWVYPILTLITAAAFYQVCTYEFINYDDRPYVYNNPNIQAGITLKAIKWAFKTGYSNNWHPLTWLSHMLDWQLFGSNPAGCHLINLIFHILNTLLLFTVLQQMTQKLWQSVFVAALFAIHPLHVESVAWVAERKDVLSTFFWILTMWAYVRFVDRPKISSYLLVVVFFAFGLMSKPMVVTLPFVLLLLDYWPLGRIGTKYSLSQLLVEKIPLFLMTLASCIVTFIVQKSARTAGELISLSLKVRIFNALNSYIEYIWKMIWPVSLAVFYPHPNRSVSILYAIISAVFLFFATALIFRFAEKHRYLLTGWFWYLGTLVPVIGIVQVGEQAMADRYSYITLTGLFIIIAWGVPDLLAKRRCKKITLTLSALAVIAALSVCTYFQVHHWKNSLTLFQHALDVTKDNYKAHDRIGTSLYEQGGMNEAIYHYKKAIEINPSDVGVYVNLSLVLAEEGKLNEAVKYLTEALRISPYFISAHASMSNVLALQGNFDGAASHLTEVIRLDPSFAEAYYRLGQVLTQRGKIEEAIKHFEEALRLKPDWADPMNDLAWYLATSKETAIRNPERAIGLAKQACDLTGYEKPEFLDTLATAYAGGGDFSKAIEAAEKALELCQSSGQDALEKEIAKRLDLYKAGKPYIEAK